MTFMIFVNRCGKPLVVFGGRNECYTFLMLGGRIFAVSVLLGLPLTILAAPPFVQTSLPGRAFSSPRAGALLHQPQHAARLVHVLGIVRGMTNKLENLSQRLDNQSAAVDRRLAALHGAGQTITVDSELEALHAAITQAQNQITNLIQQLNAILESDHPGQVVPQVREMIGTLRSTLEEVRAAFQKLRLAVRDDIRTPSVSPSPVSATPTP